ncbi:sulfatase family protein [Nitrosopumilus maritimus]|uniref:Sulfatase n=1 Tax=Nitrosopumilus maritimus (strain SCM1) TaxID=436308 RepID=A9A1T3_NITMS|nr:sulfatase-like hydrolase/transferase [Nitrosopumilus maritimus]ABX12054.1 sulfatase [Nitrosopumilus maritimus SCM1]
MAKENLIIIMIDGGRFDYGLNSKVFQEVEKTSVFFSNSITYGPHTIAAMHAVFSGCYGTRTGTNSYWSTYDFKKESFVTLTEYLSSNGYFTSADLINELVVPKQGFDEYIVHDEINDDLTLRHKKILSKIQTKNQKGQPSFLYLHYSKIHTGIMNEVLKKYDNFSDEFFDNPDQNKNRYEKLFISAENYLKTILEEIKKLGLDDNSLILIMSDHGVSVGEKFGERAYGAFCYDYTLKTITHFISKKFQSKRITQQVRTIDFMPTILQFLKIPLDNTKEPLDGVSLMPLINNKKIDEQFAYSETGNPLKEKQPPKIPNVMSIRNSNWKLIYNLHNDSKEMYNLLEDPLELKNLIGTNNEIESMLWNELLKIQQSN